MPKYHNWDPQIDLNELLNMYIKIEERQRESPVTLELPDPPEKEPQIGGEPQRQRFFTPSLQHQRNMMVYDIISRGCIEKMAVLGCGELSFEKYALKDLADAGVYHVVSIDIDEKALSNGIDNMNGYIKHHADYTVKREKLPTHIEVYKGDIMTPSPVLNNIGIAVSTEVIEHMPLEKATELLKFVLEKIKPTYYILSTPNYEYNVAFNRTEGFRHDDHHFEFTRAEFAKWLSDNVEPPYTYEIIFCGQLDGHTHLEGATQFAVIRNEKYVEGTPHGSVFTENEGALEKVGDFIYRASYFRLVESVVVGALRKFLDAYPFDPKELTKMGTLEFWRISMEKILEYRTKPSIDIDEADGMLIITRMFSCICYNSEMPDTHKKAISIPSSFDKNTLVRNVDNRFWC